MNKLQHFCHPSQHVTSLKDHFTLTVEKLIIATCKKHIFERFLIWLKHKKRILHKCFAKCLHLFTSPLSHYQSIPYGWRQILHPVFTFSHLYSPHNVLVVKHNVLSVKTPTSGEDKGECTAFTSIALIHNHLQSQWRREDKGANPK